MWLWCKYTPRQNVCHHVTKACKRDHAGITLDRCFHTQPGPAGGSVHNHRGCAGGTGSGTRVKQQPEGWCEGKPNHHQIWVVAGIRAKVLEEILMIQAHKAHISNKKFHPLKGFILCSPGFFRPCVSYGFWKTGIPSVFRGSLGGTDHDRSPHQSVRHRDCTVWRVGWCLTQSCVRCWGGQGLGLSVGWGLAGALGDTAGALTQAAAVSEPCSSIWLLPCDSGSRGCSAVAAAALHPLWLLRVMVGSTGAVPPPWALGCCLLAGTWIVGAPPHTVCSP